MSDSSARDEELREEAANPATAGKGRPTPRRKDVEASRKRALVLDVKSDAKQRRDRRRSEREAELKALAAGDEHGMPAEHRGTDRRFIRDYIDSRSSVAEFLLPTSLLFVILSLLFSKNTGAAGFLVLVFYLIVIVAIIETVVMKRRLKKALLEKFGQKGLRTGWSFYAITRHLNIRRLRQPKPKVKRGDYPL